MRSLLVCATLVIGCLGALKLGACIPGPATADDDDSLLSKVETPSDKPKSTSDTASYYMIVYAYQTTPNKPKYSHTFATFIKSSKQDDSAFEAHTISWLPRTLNIVVLRRDSEPGVNLDLHKTIELGLSYGGRVSQWGPFQIQPELYERALAQIDRLESGAIGYKALDREYRLGGASNCIHAVSDIDTDNGILVTGLDRGDAAAAAVVEHLSRWIIEPGNIHPWINERLNPGRKYPIVQR
jgi:hypothetical protein